MSTVHHAQDNFALPASKQLSILSVTVHMLLFGLPELISTRSTTLSLLTISLYSKPPPLICEIKAYFRLPVKASLIHLSIFPTFFIA